MGKPSVTLSTESRRGSVIPRTWSIRQLDHWNPLSGDRTIGNPFVVELRVLVILHYISTTVGDTG